MNKKKRINKRKAIAEIALFGASVGLAYAGARLFGAPNHYATAAVCFWLSGCLGNLCSELSE